MRNPIALIKGGRQTEQKLTKARGTARTLIFALWGVLLAVYVAAKIDFFTRYGALGYVREHSRYWAAMVGIVLLVCALERELSARRSL